MKTLINQSALILLLTVSLFTGCKKNDDNQPSSSSSTLPAIITAGTWKVSYYHENSDDHTSNFIGYTFTFNSNGTMTATNSGGSTNGTWSIDDSSNEFHMTIGSSSPLKDLDSGWLIISQSSSQINLKDDNTTHNEELHFTKI